MIIISVSTLKKGREHDKILLRALKSRLLTTNLSSKEINHGITIYK